MKGTVQEKKERQRGLEKLLENTLYNAVSSDATEEA